MEISLGGIGQGWHAPVGKTEALILAPECKISGSKEVLLCRSVSQKLQLRATNHRIRTFGEHELVSASCINTRPCILREEAMLEETTSLAAGLLGLLSYHCFKTFHRTLE